MDNKNEKTFADLFSSSTFNQEEGMKQDSEKLGHLLQKQDSDKKEHNITFDNLFEKAAEENHSFESEIEEQKDDTVKLNNIFELSKENSEELNKQLLSSSEELVESSPASNLFFESDAISNEKSTDAILEDNHEVGKDKFNPFFIESSNSKEAIPTVLDQINSSSQQTEETLANPFFDDHLNQEEGKSNFEQNQLDLTGADKEDGSLQNPFFENKTEVQKEIKSNDTDVSQNHVMSSTGEELVIENPFFETSLEEGKSNFETSSIKNEQPSASPSPFFEKKVSESQEVEKVSTSPFFEEEQAQEDNPFFLNKLNLIENEKHETKGGTIDPSKSKHFNVKIVKKKEPLFKFILGVLSYALFIWLLLIGITLLVYVLDIKIRAAKGDTSSPTFNAYVVLTGSMLPEIQVYDVVVTKKVDVSTLKEGDVITFASADSRFLNTIITHRIIKKNYDKETNKYSFQTKGDNNNVADSALVPQNNIYGKVILKIPKLGYLQEFLASDGGWIIVILIPCLVVISYDIVKLVKGLKRKKYKNIKVQK